MALTEWQKNNLFDYLLNNYDLMIGDSDYAEIGEIVSQIEPLVMQKDTIKARKFDEILHKINSIMWNSYHLENTPFGNTEGRQIAELLVEWAEIE